MLALLGLGLQQTLDPLDLNGYLLYRVLFLYQLLAQFIELDFAILVLFTQLANQRILLFNLFLLEKKMSNISKLVNISSEICNIEL